MTSSHPHNRPATSRRGMTLVELLVVVVVLLLLLVSVGPILAPSDGLRGREAAATLGAMIDRSQRRAETNGDRGAGIWLQPLAADLPRTPRGNSVSTPPSAGVLDLFACEPQNSYIGDDPESAQVYVHRVNDVINGNPVTLVNDPFIGVNPTDAIAVFSQLHCPAIHQICGKSTRIEIGGHDYYFRLYPPSEQAGLNPGYFPEPYRPHNYQNYIDAGMTSVNNYYTTPFKAPADGTSAPGIWTARIRTIPGGASLPSSPPPGLLGFDPGEADDPSTTPADETRLPEYPAKDVGVPFKIARPLTRSATPPLTLPDGYCVDLAWSCVGFQFFHSTGTPAMAGFGTIPQPIDGFLSDRPVQILFNREGAISGVTYLRGVTGMGGGLAEIEETMLSLGDVYLLIGRVDRAANPYVATPTEATPGANWQYPDSRWVKISSTTGAVLIADPLYGAANVLDSQQYARNDIPATRN